jgi:thiol-disulfide isomerase/thioredoxin
MKRVHVFLVGVIAAAPISVRAAEFTMNARTDGIELGKPVMGPKVSPEDLKGRVVLLEFWGRNCAPCLASLPHVAQLSEQYGPFGLVVIGAHAQEGTPEQIRERAKSRGVSFAVVEHARVKDVNDMNGIPHCILFDHTGKCLYRGSPEEIDGKIRDALANWLSADLEGTPNKAVNSLIESLKKGQLPAQIVQKTVSLSRSAEKDTAKQAKSMLAKLTDAAGKELKGAESLRAEEPLMILSRLTHLSIDFKGTPPGTKANELLTELKKDKVVIAELKVRPMLEKIRAVDAELQAILKDGDPKGAEFQKSQAAVLKQLQGAIKQLKKSAPDAPSLKDAVEVGEKYGLNVK